MRLGGTLLSPFVAMPTELYRQRGLRSLMVKANTAGATLQILAYSIVPFAPNENYVHAGFITGVEISTIWQLIIQCGVINSRVDAIFIENW